MDIMFNFIVIALVLLIAYWWANQGFFSALLHLLAVILAGAIALGFWDIVARLMMGHNATLDQFAYGISLVGLFSISLLGFRLATDRIAGANVNVPRSADLVGGGICGLGAGILTVGLLMIGCGFTYSHNEIMGYRGYGRAQQNGEVADGRLKALWLPAEELTSKFFAYVSAGALYPDFAGTPLYQYNPDLHRQMYLVRDSYDDGKGALSMPPDAATIEGLYYEPGSTTVGVLVEFGKTAKDFADQLALASSQVRLIGDGRGPASAPVVYPSRWVQNIKDAPYIRQYGFNQITNYATSVPGRDVATIMFEFDVPASFRPELIQIRNVPYRLPAAEAPPEGGLYGAYVVKALDEIEDEAVKAQLAALTPAQINELEELRRSQSEGVAQAGGDITAAVIVSNKTAPIRFSANQKPSGLDLVEVDERKYIAEGFASIQGSDRGLIGRKQRVDRFYEPAGTRLVMVDVGWSSLANIFIDRFYKAVQLDDQLTLVDSGGFEYKVIGFMHESDEEIVLRLEPDRELGALPDLPKIPRGSGDRLRLLFYIPTGSTLKELYWGNPNDEGIRIGTMTVRVTEEE